MNCDNETIESDEDDPPDLRLLMPELGGPDKLRLIRGEPAPKPVRGEVRIRVQTTGLSPADLLMMWGLHPERRPPPFVPGWDVIGTVDRIGEGMEGAVGNENTSEVKVGDRVAAITIVGGLARYVCVTITHAVRVPDGIDLAEAQCLVFDWAVAYQMIHRVTRPPDDARVLVQGAAGSIESALVILGRILGWKAIYGTASTCNIDRVREDGCIPIDYRRENFRTVIIDCEPNGLDVVFDGLGHTVLHSYRCLASNGALVAYGHAPTVAGGKRRWNTLVNILLQFGIVRSAASLSHCKVHLYSIQKMRREHPEWYRDDLTRLFSMLATGQIKPRVFERVKLDEAADALTRISQGEARGKIIVDLTKS